MGIKCIVKSYAWANDFADGILPFDYLFVNIGQHIIKQVYIAFFCDMDVGPVNVSGYWNHDYACYIPELRTAYVNNAVDAGSTPMGLTLLHTPKPLDSLKYIFQWHGFNEPGTLDSVIYSWMSGEAFTELIKPCQSPSSPTDTRFFFSFGPFEEMKPGDSLKISVALVGGLSVAGGAHNLFANAQNALTLYDSNYVLGVKTTSSDIPTQCHLYQNYPNPFNPSTSISFSIPKQSHVRIEIFNPLGQLIATLVDEDKHPGYYSVTWNANNSTSGVYFYRMTAGDLVQTKGLLVIR